MQPLNLWSFVQKDWMGLDRTRLSQCMIQDLFSFATPELNLDLNLDLQDSLQFNNINMNLSE